MRALRRWMRKTRCRAKYGKACPHGGHYGGKRRTSISSAQPRTHAAKAPANRAQGAMKRSTDDARADA